MNPSRPPAAPSRSRPTDFAFEVHYVRQMPSDVPVWAEKVLIVGSWWIRRFARDGRNTAVVVVLIWALANLYQFSHGEEIIGLLTPGMVSFGIILWLTGHGIGILFGGLPLHHRVVLLPPGVKRTLPFRYKLLDAACAAVLVTVLVWAAWETRPAATEARRQLSCEPLLSAIDLSSSDRFWVIIGGESGPKARPMVREHARRIMLQCALFGTPVFFKQVGSKRGPDWPDTITGKGDDPSQWPPEFRVQQFPEPDL